MATGPGRTSAISTCAAIWSDETIAALDGLEAVRRQYAPQLPAVSNLWPDGGQQGLRLSALVGKLCRPTARRASIPAIALGAAFEVMMMRGRARTPVWFNEFTAGGGGYYGTPGRSRMWAYFGLLNYAQAFLAWTFNTHLGGEEQALFGLVDHDGRPSWKVDEFAPDRQRVPHDADAGLPALRAARRWRSLIRSRPTG